MGKRIPKAAPDTEYQPAHTDARCGVGVPCVHYPTRRALKQRTRHHRVHAGWKLRTR